jgi:solute carrier family 35, member E3
MFASLINISQFFIIAQTGAVSSTVVGHLKTCTIVALGWIVSGRPMGDKSIIGVAVAIGGITMYERPPPFLSAPCFLFRLIFPALLAVTR